MARLLNVSGALARRMAMVLGAGGLIWTAMPQAAETMPSRALTVGVAPYLSTRALLEIYHPVETYLRGRLKVETQVFTATDFRAFYANAIKGDYDLAVMPSHLARLAQLEHGFVPLVRYVAGGRGLVVSKNGTPIAKPDDLRGQKVAVPDRLALATILCLEWLKARNIWVERDFQVVRVPSFNSAMYALEQGDAVAAITAPGPLAQMSSQLRGNIRVLVDTGDYVSLVYMAHPRIASGTRAWLKSTLLEFAGDTAGRRFFSGTGFDDFMAVGPDDLKPLDPYLDETKRLLAVAPSR